MSQNKFDQEKFEILRKIGNGGCGNVYDVTYNDKPLVAKCSKSVNHDHSLKVEYSALKHMKKNGVKGVPTAGFKFKYTHNDKTQNYFLMEKLGMDLKKYVKMNHANKLPLNKTLVIAIQSLKIMESFHNCGVIHNDIKPDNILFGLKDPSQIFFIDFGFSSKYLTEAGQHIIESEIINNGGFPPCMSLNRLLKKVPSRRDDLESLAYTLIKLRSGRLPWTYIYNKKLSFDLKNEEVIKEKKKSAEVICQGIEKEFQMFLEDVRKLGFSEKPPYSKYIDLFFRLLGEEVFKTE